MVGSIMDIFFTVHVVSKTMLNTKMLAILLVDSKKKIVYKTLDVKSSDPGNGTILN